MRFRRRACFFNNVHLVFDQARQCVINKLTHIALVVAVFRRIPFTTRKISLQIRYVLTRSCAIFSHQLDSLTVAFICALTLTIKGKRNGFDSENWQEKNMFCLITVSAGEGYVDRKREKNLVINVTKYKGHLTIQKMSMVLIPLTIRGATKKKKNLLTLWWRAVHPFALILTDFLLFTPVFLSTFSLRPVSIYFDSSLSGLFASSARDTYWSFMLMLLITGFSFF